MWRKEMPKALIVNDQVKTILSLNKLLKDGGYVVSSSCGEQAVRTAMEESPQVILLEILLNKHNGFEVLRQLKDNPRTNHIPVVMTTELNLQVYWDEAYALGASAYLVMPRHLPWLLKKIEDVIHPSHEKRHWKKTTTKLESSIESRI